MKRGKKNRRTKRRKEEEKKRGGRMMEGKKCKERKEGGRGGKEEGRKGGRKNIFSVNVLLVCVWRNQLFFAFTDCTMRLKTPSVVMINSGRTD